MNTAMNQNQNSQGKIHQEFLNEDGIEMTSNNKVTGKLNM